MRLCGNSYLSTAIELADTVSIFSTTSRATFGRRPAARGSLRSPCSPANTRARTRAGESHRRQPGARQRQQRAPREARSRGAPPAAIRGRPGDAAPSERQLRAWSRPRVQQRTSSEPISAAPRLKAMGRAEQRYAARAMTAKDKLRQAVEELTELEAEQTLAFITRRRDHDPVAEAFENAP